MPGTRSMILDSRMFDEATIISSTASVVGFPVENLQDPQPQTSYRVGEGPGSAFFVVDFGSSFTHSITAVAALFVNAVPRALPTTDFTWRIRSGIASSGTGITDTGAIPFWPSIPSLAGNYQDPQFYYLRGIGANSVLALPNPVSVRYMRVDLTWVGVPQAFVSMSRFFTSQAIEPTLPYGTGLPTPIGAPAKQHVPWRAHLTTEQYDRLYALSLDAGSNPRYFTSWGHERFLLDGARTVVAVNNLNAQNSWELQRMITYGFIERLGDAVAVDYDQVEVPLTFDSL